MISCSYSPKSEHSASPEAPYKDMLEAPVEEGNIMDITEMDDDTGGSYENERKLSKAIMKKNSEKTCETKS